MRLCKKDAQADEKYKQCSSVMPCGNIVAKNARSRRGGLGTGRTANALEYISLKIISMRNEMDRFHFTLNR